MAVKLIDKLEFDNFDKTTYTNVAVIKTKPLDENMKLNTSLADGFIVLTKDGVQVTEIEDGALDDENSKGKFCCGSDGKVKIIVDKTTIDTVEKAKEELAKYQATVEMKDDLEYEKDLFDVTMVDVGTNKKIFNTVLLSGEKMLGYINNNVETIDLVPTNPIRFIVEPKLK
ncbi:phage virion protein [Clostridium botulinum B str. Osaka05]|uniref:Phage virion protein n=1 Tax=Clostridium botulinum B str. Osaka05 TaxID=1407017 RepID=A0A060N369_CLOBO|nr:hypothetical protein [Clostridium botulinum]BAO04896.1 phage virion protein [Clostridium botulinum B str. Osaka05]